MLSPSLACLPRAKAKFWLDPVAFASATGFSARELWDVQGLTAYHSPNAYSDRRGMTALAPAVDLTAAPRASTARVGEDTLTLELAGGHTFSAPLVWCPHLLADSAVERENLELIGTAKASTGLT